MIDETFGYKLCGVYDAEDLQKIMEQSEQMNLSSDGFAPVPI